MGYVLQVGETAHNYKSGLLLLKVKITETGLQELNSAEVIVQAL